MTVHDLTQSLALHSRRVVTPHGTIEGTVVVRGEAIEAVLRGSDAPAGLAVERLGDLVLMPGLVDMHVHINEPGREEWEGFQTATRAAIAGGTTTLVDMPLNSCPVTTSVEALQAKSQAAAGKCWCDVGLYGGIVPGNQQEIGPLCDAGVWGIKAFLCDSGLDDFPCVDADQLKRAAEPLAKRQVPLLVHAEIAPRPVRGDPRRYANYLASRPEQCELDAIGLLVDLVRQHVVSVHIVHLSAATAVPLLKSARAEKLAVSVETCPHYLYFHSEDIADGDTRLKCAPPVRDNNNQEGLWRALDEGVIDVIASDHSPCPPRMKYLDAGDFGRAWGGISSLGLGLSIIWTCSRARRFGLDDLVRWMAQGPADLLGMGRKGRIEAGADADILVVDPDARWQVTSPGLHNRHKLTPYEGREFQGRVRRTYLRGRLVYEDGRWSGSPCGVVMRRGW